MKAAEGSMGVAIEQHTDRVWEIAKHIEYAVVCLGPWVQSLTTYESTMGKSMGDHMSGGVVIWCFSSFSFSSLSLSLPLSL